MKTEELANCPFCGGKAVERKADMMAFYVECNLCGNGTKFNPTPKFAAQAWNTRPSPWTPIDGVESLPKEVGPHLFKQVLPSEGDDDMFDVIYLGLGTAIDKADYLLSHYIAWMPIPPSKGDVLDTEGV